jgi:glycosyltransferase involved in cell wall biosynthesis
VRIHVAIDLRVADAPGMELTGAGRYALETARALAHARPQWRYSLFSNRPELLDVDGDVAILGTRLPTQRSIARVAWLHSAAALPALRRKPDLWFSPAFVLPVWWRGPSLVTVHDLTFMLLRERYRGRANALYATAATRYSARRADRVLCGSQATRALLLTHLGLDAGRVDVIPYGVAETFFAEPAVTADRGDELADRPYLLFVGTWEARKGLPVLLEAMRRVNAHGARVRVVLAGQRGWGTEQVLGAMRRDPAVELRERPDDEQLARLYRDALALVYPSEMEGFGLPVAEAMACGCPVIASDLPSIREFAGDLPLYIEPGDSARLAGHVESLLQSPDKASARSLQARRVVDPLRWSALGERMAELIEGLPRLGSAPPAR